MATDSELLLEYARDHSERAFAELVRGHIDLVYSAAVRRLGGDQHAAAEVTQQVFLAMARNAERLARHPVLNAWLHTSTRNAAANFRRSERRRERQKHQLQAMQEPHLSEPVSVEWESVRGVLDAAMDELNEADRLALILRFFEGHSYPEMGGKLGLREETVRRRVDRALEKLRVRLERHGVSSTAAVLGGALGAHGVMAAPAGLAASVAASAAVTSLAAASTGVGLFAFMTTTKLTMTLVGVTILAGALGYRIGATRNVKSPLAASAPNVAPTVPENDGATNALVAWVQEKRGGAAAGLSPAMTEAADKIAALRDVLARLPEQRIPEIKLATDGDWYVAVEGNLETPDDYRRALGKLRALAEKRLARLLQPALRAYLEANGHTFPTEVAQLRGFVGAEVDDAMLRRYRVAPASEISHVRMGGDWAITQVNLIDSEYDQHSVIGPRGFGSATSNRSSSARARTLLQPAIKAYQDAHPDRPLPLEISALMPYATSPEQRAAIDKLAKEQAVR